MRWLKLIKGFSIIGYIPLGVISKLTKWRNIYYLAIPYSVRIDARNGLKPEIFLSQNIDEQDDKHYNRFVFFKKPFGEVLVEAFKGIYSANGIANRLIFCYTNKTKRLVENIDDSIGELKDVINYASDDRILIDIFKFPWRKKSVKSVNGEDEYTKDINIDVDFFALSYLMFQRSKGAEVFDEVLSRIREKFDVEDVTFSLNDEIIVSIPVAKIPPDAEINYLYEPLLKIYEDLANIIETIVKDFLRIASYRLYDTRGGEILSKIESIENHGFIENPAAAKRKRREISKSLERKILQYVIDNKTFVLRLDEIDDENLEDVLIKLDPSMIFVKTRKGLIPLVEFDGDDYEGFYVVRCPKCNAPMKYLGAVDRIDKEFLVNIRKLEDEQLLNDALYAVCVRDLSIVNVNNAPIILVRIDVDDIDELKELLEEDKLAAIHRSIMNSYIKGNVENDTVLRSLQKAAEVLNKELIPIAKEERVIVDAPKEIDVIACVKGTWEHHLLLIEVKRKVYQSPREAIRYYTYFLSNDGKVNIDWVFKLAESCGECKKLNIIYAFFDTLPRIPSSDRSSYAEVVEKVRSKSEVLSSLINSLINNKQNGRKAKIDFKYYWFGDVVKYFSKDDTPEIPEDIDDIITYLYAYELLRNL